MIEEETREQVEAAETSQATPIKVKKLGHVVYRVRDIQRSTQFWTEILGFKVSDINEKGMVFLRHGSDHHTVALAEAPRGAEMPGEGTLMVEHFAMELGSLDDLFRAREFFKSKGVPIYFEGRRGPGCNPGVEFYDPDGYLIELYADMEQIGWNGKSRPSELWQPSQVARGRRRQSRPGGLALTPCPSPKLGRGGWG